MISDIAKVLEASGITVPDKHDIDLNIRMSHHLSVYVSVSGSSTCFIKIVHESNKDVLQNEYMALSTFSDQRDIVIPRPIALQYHSEHAFLLLSTINCKPITRLQEIAGSPLACDKWLSAIRTLGSHGSAKEKSASIEKLYSEFPKLVREYIGKKHVSRIVGDLPRMDQHGDLSRKNIGHQGGVPTIYDWEDFGHVDVPGYDVAILIGSYSDHTPTRILQCINSDEEEGVFCRNLIYEIGLEVYEFVLLMPIYYAIFWRIKEKYEYKHEIREVSLKSCSEFAALLSD